jgi:hypothetical protein
VLNSTDRSNVYGETYLRAAKLLKERERVLEKAAESGFESEEECRSFAKANLLDIIVYSESQKRFWASSHLGELVTFEHWQKMYADVLYWTSVNAKGEYHTRRWKPEGYALFRNARNPGEEPDGIHAPLFHRDYFTPTGAYNEDTGTFNVARPSTVFAKATGADTSHIYEYLRHVAGDCYMHLLSWLRHKLLWPTVKTEIVPVLVSKLQGSGKSTLANCLCRGLFGESNVIVSHQYDGSSRFNSDYADKLVISIEEKEEGDRRNTHASLKSSATATEIRKEKKGIDPVYQKSYTEYILTTNEDVPVKFEDSGTQRRFMVMQSDERFSRDTSALADEVFTKLYGEDGNRNITGKAFYNDRAVIAQFKHELASSPEIAAVNLHNFPKTEAYHRCFSLPRNNDTIEIEMLVKSLMPFIAATLKTGLLTDEVVVEGETVYLKNVIPVPQAIIFRKKCGPAPDRVGVNQFVVFCDSSGRAYPHPTVERVVNNLKTWMREEWNLSLLADTEGPTEGFKGILSKAKHSPAYWFVHTEDDTRYTYDGKGWAPMAVDGERELPLPPSPPPPPPPPPPAPPPPPKTLRDEAREDAELGRRLHEREGKRGRFNASFVYDPEGEFETVNDMARGSTRRIAFNCVSMDTFLLECDSASEEIVRKEAKRLEEAKPGETLRAEELFRERLEAQSDDADYMFEEELAARIVYSGFKSLHVLIRVTDPPSTKEEYRWLHGYLIQTLSRRLEYDPRTNDPLRLTRAPVRRERTTIYEGRTVTGTQKLLREDWRHVYDTNWRPAYENWRKRKVTPFEKAAGKRLKRPVKKEYEDAALALCEGTFWTNAAFNGNRQRLFFPAYRLIYSMGFTHDRLWSDDGILDGLDKYYKPEDIRYWRTRADCPLVAEIERDIDSGEDDDG